jgi:hypothetical protein
LAEVVCSLPGHPFHPGGVLLFLVFLPSLAILCAEDPGVRPDEQAQRKAPHQEHEEQRSCSHGVVNMFGKGFPTTAREPCVPEVGRKAVENGWRQESARKGHGREIAGDFSQGGCCRLTID